jgi:Flp pilus assembly pilin Flp
MLQLFTRYQLWAATEEGATAVEYAILVALIALVIVAGVTAFGGALNAKFTSMAANNALK